MLSTTKSTLQSQSHVFLSKEKPQEKQHFVCVDTSDISGLLRVSDQPEVSALSLYPGGQLLPCFVVHLLAVPGNDFSQVLLIWTSSILPSFLEESATVLGSLNSQDFGGFLLLFALIYWTIWLSFRKSAINSYVEWFAFSRLSSL